MTEERLFYIIDDGSESFFAAQFWRTQEQVRPELWALKPGECLPIDGECWKAYQYSGQSRSNDAG